MSWVKPYFTRQAEWFGPTGIFPEHRERAAVIERLCGGGPKRILELGSGAGGTAAAMADLGHTVVAVELSPARVAHARGLAKERPNLLVLEADFYSVELTGRFDVVCYWDGFGVGTDDDQRRLLRRVAHKWLAEDGKMLLDVYLPSTWAARAGEEERLSHLWRLVEGEVRTVDLDIPLKKRYDFDPLSSRMSIELWPIRKRREAIKQWVRCYAPADLVLLLEGTGLRATWFEANGEAFDVEAERRTFTGSRATVQSYLVRLELDQ